MLNAEPRIEDPFVTFKILSYLAAKCRSQVAVNLLANYVLTASRLWTPQFHPKVGCVSEKARFDYLHTGTHREWSQVSILYAQHHNSSICH